MHLWAYMIKLFQSQASPESMLTLSLLLLVCLIAGEISALVSDQRVHRLSRVLNLVSIPLGVVFIVNAATMLSGVLK